MSVVQVYTNGRILSSNGLVDSFSVRDGKIITLDDSPGEGNRSVRDLEGRCVVPGFIDAHTHMLRLGLELNGLSLEGITSREEAISLVKRYASDPGRDVIVGYGWDESLWKENRFLYEEDLKFTEKPVILFRRDEHMAVVNAPVIRNLGLKGNEASSGIVREEGLRGLRKFLEPDDSMIIQALDSAISRAASLGIVGVRDIVDARTERIYSRMNMDFHVSRAIYDYNFTPEFGSDSGDWGVKVFLDGSIGSLTAAHAEWDKSNLKMEPGKLLEHLQEFWHHGLPVAVHAIGEVAVQAAVDVLSKSAIPVMNSIEHFELTEDEVLERIPDNTAISAQPNFLVWAGRNGMYEKNLGHSWLRKNNVFRKIIDRNLPLAFGSDCMPIGPVFGIMQAVNSEFQEQRITLEEGIRAYTEGSSMLLGTGSIKGSISPGFDADFAVFEQGFLDNGPRNGSYSPLETVIGGNTVYSSYDEAGR